VPAADGVIDRLLADPPVVHYMDMSAEPPLGLWATEESCYRFLAAHVRAGDRTLETGAGLSTAVLAALGAEHRCITVWEPERDRLLEYFAAHGIPSGTVTFDVSPSHVALPRLLAETTAAPLDLVLLDGCHGFPIPALDWFYAGSLLREGGILVTDDVDLPAVGELVRFLDADPRWDAIERTGKWVAWRRGSSGPLAEEWVDQPFLTSPTTARDRVRRLLGRVRRRLGGR
jgi:predicted O-methyltransferase YrrM